MTYLFIFITHLFIILLVPHNWFSVFYVLYFLFIFIVQCIVLYFLYTYGLFSRNKTVLFLLYDTTTGAEEVPVSLVNAQVSR